MLLLYIYAEIHYRYLILLYIYIYTMAVKKPKESMKERKLRKCKELLKKHKNATETKADKEKKIEKEVNKEYKKIQNNIQNIDEIKDNVDTIKKNIDDEFKEKNRQPELIEDNGEFAEMTVPLEKGLQKPEKYTPSVKKELYKSYLTKINKVEADVNKLKLDQYEKEEKKTLERKKILVELNDDTKLPEMVKLEVLDKLNKIVVERNRKLPKMIEKAGLTNYKENPIMVANLFPQFKINQVYSHTATTDYTDMFVEHNRFIKDILTDFVNKDMLTTNEHQIRLMAVIYKNMNPWLEKTGSRLIFYGGNLMRQIHRNVNEYFDPDSQDLFEKLFGNFVKKSDNDFSLMLGTGPLEFGNGSHEDMVKQFDEYYNKCYVEVSYILEKIRDEIMSDLFSHFSFFKYSDEYKKVEYNRIKLYLQEAASKIDDRIKIDDVRISTRNDQILLFPDNTIDFKKKDKINYYKNKENNVIYNSYNNALHFATPAIAHFALLRSKVNFTIEGTFVSSKTKKPYKMAHQYGGELIDFGMPYLVDGGAFGLKSKKYKEYGHEGKEWLQKWLNRKVEVIRNEEYDFEYMLYGNRYQVELLFWILFFFPGRPWLAPKYDKRVSRSILFEFYYLLDQYPVGLESLRTIKEHFLNMDTDMLKIIVKESKRAYETIENDDDRKNYYEWIAILKKYVTTICIGIDSLIEYFDGKKRITKKQLFKLNIV